MARSLGSLRREKAGVAKLLETTAPSGILTVDMCEVDGTLAGVLTLIMFETGTMRSKTGRQTLRSVSIQIFDSESSQLPRDYSADNFCD